MNVREYLTADGKNLYREWLDTLDVTPRARIQARVFRFSTGNLGELLLGGDKSTQAVDVVRAQELWRVYQEGKGRGKTK